MADLKDKFAIGEQALLNVKEAAAHLNIGVSHLYNLMERGELPYVKIGRTRRLRREAVDAFVHRHTFGPRYR